MANGNHHSTTGSSAISSSENFVSHERRWIYGTFSYEELCRPVVLSTTLYKCRLSSSIALPVRTSPVKGNFLGFKSTTVSTISCSCRIVIARLGPARPFTYIHSTFSLGTLERKNKADRPSNQRFVPVHTSYHTHNT